MTGCAVEWIGDGYCDDFNNKAECKYDYADCCDNTSPGWDKYCDDCENCLMWSSALHPTQCIESWKGDTFCDDFNNKVGCNYDGGDCCLDPKPADSDKYCVECNCIDPDSGGECKDIWKKKKCLKKKKNKKCNKKAIVKKCQKTCGKCVPN